MTSLTAAERVKARRDGGSLSPRFATPFADYHRGRSTRGDEEEDEEEEPVPRSRSPGNRVGALQRQRLKKQGANLEDFDVVGDGEMSQYEREFMRHKLHENTAADETENTGAAPRRSSSPSRLTALERRRLKKQAEAYNADFDGNGDGVMSPYEMEYMRHKMASASPGRTRPEKSEELEETDTVSPVSPGGSSGPRLSALERRRLKEKGANFRAEFDFDGDGQNSEYETEFMRHKLQSTVTRKAQPQPVKEETEEAARPLSPRSRMSALERRRLKKEREAYNADFDLDNDGEMSAYEIEFMRHKMAAQSVGDEIQEDDAGRAQANEAIQEAYSEFEQAFEEHKLMKSQPRKPKRGKSVPKEEPQLAPAPVVEANEEDEEENEFMKAYSEHRFNKLNSPRSPKVESVPSPEPEPSPSPPPAKAKPGLWDRMAAIHDDMENAAADSKPARRSDKFRKR